MAMVGAQQRDQLRSAIEFRDLIGQAEGNLMERFKLRDIATELVEQGTLPNLPR